MRLAAVVTVALITAVSINILLYTAIHGNEKAAESVVRKALLSLRDNDAQELKLLLHSKSRDRYAMRKAGRFEKVVLYTRNSFQLQSESREALANSVVAVSGVSDDLIYDILSRNLADYECPADISEASPIVVRYTVGKADMISIALMESGKWKVATTPLYMSANVLNYSSVSEAIEHNDALVDPKEALPEH